MTKISIAVGAAALVATAIYAVPALTQGAPRQRLDTPAPRALPTTPAVAPSTMGQVQLTFAPVVKRVVPAVVNVYARTVTQVQANPFANDPFFSQFFGANPEMRQRVQQSLGSGVIVRADGIILTNNHVVAGGTDIVVALSDKREFKARVLLADPRTDLAVLKIEAKGENLPIVPFADSDRVQVGDLVLAVGDPFGVGQTVTMGIVSALARTQISASDYQFFIQTDAAINPGNSGGALITTDGRLAGINTAIVSRSGGNVGIGFAIPANLARRVVEGVEGGLKSGTTARVQLAWVGASGQPVTSAIAASLGLPRPGGVLIKEVYPGGPLSRAGIKGRRSRPVGGRCRRGRHAVAELSHRDASRGRYRAAEGRVRQVGPRRDGDLDLAAGIPAARGNHHRRTQSPDRRPGGQSFAGGRQRTANRCDGERAL